MERGGGMSEQIEYETLREVQAALEGFEKGKREGFRLAREQIAQEIEAELRHSPDCPVNHCTCSRASRCECNCAAEDFQTMYAAIARGTG